MYHKHLKLQKMICMLCVIAAAVSFVYSLGMITDIYDALYSTMRNPNDLTQTKVPGSIIYYDMQDFNKQFTNAGIVLILLACFLLVTQSHIRRKYYFSNYLAIGVYSVATIGVNLWAHQQIEAFAEQYMTTIDFEKLKEYSDMWSTPYLDNTNLLDLHQLVLALSIVSVVALVGNAIWKIVLIQKENRLIKAGKEAA